MGLIDYIYNNTDIIVVMVVFLGVIALQVGIAQTVCKRMRQKIVQDTRSQRGNLTQRVQGIEQQFYRLTQGEKVGAERVQRIEQQLKRLAQEEKVDRVSQIWDELQTLSQQVQELTTRSRTDKQLLERLERLETGVRSGENPVIDRIPQDMLPKPTNWMNDTSPQSLMASRYSVDPEEVAFSLLDLIEPGGRSSPLARMAGLNDWLKKNHPSIVAEPIGALTRTSGAWSS